MLKLCCSLALGIGATACVTGQELRKGPEDAAFGPHGAPENRALEQARVPVVEHAPREQRPGYLWIKGYYHWDGVKYVWVPGHWEPAKPGYRWSTLARGS